MSFTTFCYRLLFNQFWLTCPWIADFHKIIRRRLTSVTHTCTYAYILLWKIHCDTNYILTTYILCTSLWINFSLCKSCTNYKTEITSCVLYKRQKFVLVIMQFLYFLISALKYIFICVLILFKSYALTNPFFNNSYDNRS